MLFTIPPAKSIVDDTVPSNSTDAGESYRVYSQDEIWYFISITLDKSIYCFQAIVRSLLAGNDPVKCNICACYDQNRERFSC